MSTTLHVVKTGHKCANPLRGTTPPASYIKAGEQLSLNGWALSYDPRQRAYNVHQDVEAWGRFHNYQFNNFNCAVARLAQMGSGVK